MVRPLPPAKAVGAAPASVSAVQTAVKSGKPSAGWYVQIRAEPTEKAAAALCTKLEGHGASTAIEPTTVKGRNYFRVLAGPHKTRADAQGAAGRLKALPFVGQDAFVKQLP